MNEAAGLDGTFAVEGRPSNEAVALVLDGCLYALLGGPASSAFRTYIKKNSNVTIAGMVGQPPLFHQCLEGVFGDSAGIIEEFMVKSLVREFSLPASLCVDLTSTLGMLKA